MKKSHLTAATALVAVLMLSGFTASAMTPATDSKAPQKTMMQRHKGPMARMSAEGSKLMREAMSKMHEENKELFAKMGTLHKELGDLMKAATFDKGAYLKKNDEIQALRAKIDSARAAAIAEVASKVSPDDRAALARPMRGPRGQGMRGKGMRGKGMGPMGGGMGPRDGSGPMGEGSDDTEE